MIELYNVPKSMVEKEKDNEDYKIEILDEKSEDKRKRLQDERDRLIQRIEEIDNELKM